MLHKLTTLCPKLRNVPIIDFNKIKKSSIMQTFYKAYAKLYNKLYTYHQTDAAHSVGLLASPGLSWLANGIWLLVLMTAGAP